MQDQPTTTIPCDEEDHALVVSILAGREPQVTLGDDGTYQVTLIVDEGHATYSEAQLVADYVRAALEGREGR